MNNAVELKAKFEEVSCELERLSAEKADLEKQIKSLEEQEAKALLNEMVVKLKALNLDPSEIAKALGIRVADSAQKTGRAARGTAEPKAKGVPKYRNSVDPSLTWTGKGRKPGWVVTYLDNGGELESLLIKE